MKKQCFVTPGASKNVLSTTLLIAPFLAFCLATFAESGCSLFTNTTHLVRITTVERMPTNFAPAFWLLFSTTPLTNADGSSKDTISWPELTNLQHSCTSGDLLVLRVHGKTGGRDLRTFEYRFGDSVDLTNSWNSGENFDWHNWSRFSDDIWDNLAVSLDPATPVPQGQLHVTNMVVIRNSETLFDSTRIQSYPNLRPMSVCLPQRNLAEAGGPGALLNLASLMRQFKIQYYEVCNGLLLAAYLELGQTDESKFARPLALWCSEFASYAYLENGFSTPNPYIQDVYWGNLRSYFSKNGRVYTVREVITWPDTKKQRIIVPGSVMSIRWADGGTHTILFSSWRPAVSNGLSSFTAISGNNGRRVYWHSNWKLPTSDSFTNMTSVELADYDQKAFFGVPDYAAYARTMFPPQLRLISSGNGFELAWTDLGVHCCYTVEQRAGLGNGVWEELGSARQLIGLFRWPAPQMSSNHGFFRLRTDLRALLP
jgi:hypothetical protein